MFEIREQLFQRNNSKFLNNIFKYVWNKKIESFGPNNTTVSFLIEDNFLEKWQAMLTWKHVDLKKKRKLKVNVLWRYNER